MATPASRPPRRRRLVEEGPVEIPVDSTILDGDLAVPEDAAGLVIFAHGSGSNRHSPRNLQVAEGLHHEGFATLLVDLLTEEESRKPSGEFDLLSLSSRLGAATAWAQGHPGTLGLPVGTFGGSTGAAVALRAAAEPGADVRAVVSRGGRPDLVGSTLRDVRSPTLLLVGSRDSAVLDLNRKSLELLGCTHKSLEIVPGASHLFDEPGAMQDVLRRAVRWFRNHLVGPAR